MVIGIAIPEGDVLGFETINPTTAKKITESIRKPVSGAFKDLEAQSALISVETQQVRFRFDGAAPTALVGHVIAAGGSYVVKGTSSVRNITFIDTASGASTVRITTLA